MTPTATGTPATAENPPRRADYPRSGDVHLQCSGTNYSLACIGPAHQLARYSVRLPRIGQTVHGKLFLHELMGLTGMEISFGLLPAQSSFPFYHKHTQNEEVYLFLQGTGEFQVDGQVMPIHEGTAVRIAPDGVRCFRNTCDQPMFYVVIQAKAGSLEQWTGSDGIGVPGEVQWPPAAPTA